MGKNIGNILECKKRQMGNLRPKLQCCCFLLI